MQELVFDTFLQNCSTIQQIVPKLRAYHRMQGGNVNVMVHNAANLHGRCLSLLNQALAADEAKYTIPRLDQLAAQGEQQFAQDRKLKQAREAMELSDTLNAMLGAYKDVYGHMPWERGD